MTTEQGRIFAIDYGTRRVGLAISDPLRVLASGRGTLENSSDLLTRITEMVQAEGVSLVIVGMPYAPDGGLGEKGREVQSFVDRLREAIPVPVDTWDESHTSVRAQEAIRSAGMRRRARQAKGRIDEMAARIMLQEFLDNGMQASAIGDNHP